MIEVEKNIARDENAEARMAPKPRKKMSSATGTNFKFTNASDNTEARAAMKDKAYAYGNSAQRTATADDGLHKLGLKSMQKFREEIKCERSSIIFFDNIKKDMFFYADEKRYRFDMDQGIAGHCASTGEILNVPDAYADPRFFPGVDRQTGFKTRNVLSAPIRARNGDAIVAVIQMLNKNRKEVRAKRGEGPRACDPLIAPPPLFPPNEKNY